MPPVQPPLCEPGLALTSQGLRFLILDVLWGGEELMNQEPGTQQESAEVCGHQSLVRGGSLLSCLSPHLTPPPPPMLLGNLTLQETEAPQPELGSLEAESPKKLGPRLRCQVTGPGWARAKNARPSDPVGGTNNSGNSEAGVTG